LFLVTLLDLIFISQASILIPVIGWLVLVRKASMSLKFIYAATLLAGMAEILQILFAFWFKHNIVIVNLSCIPNLILFFLAYYLHKDFTPPVRRVIGITGLAGILFLLINLLRQDIHEIILPNFIATSTALILLALVYFFHKIYFTTDFEVSRHPFFYISSALFIYHLSVFTVFATYDMFPEDDSYNYLWTLKLILYIFFNVLLAYSFYIFKKYRLSL
jgi:hypothetical protein